MNTTDKNNYSKKHILADLFFLSTIEGGRKLPIPLTQFGCPVFFDNVMPLCSSGHGYDCRIAVNRYGKEIYPGEEVKSVALKFLFSDVVMPYMQPGINFTLWEGKIIAHGIVTSVEEDGFVRWDDLASKN